MAQRVLALIDQTIMVSEAEMEMAIVALLHNEGVLAEGAGAISLAPLIQDLGGRLFHGNTLVLITGGNISTTALMKCFSTQAHNPEVAALLGHQTTALPSETPRPVVRLFSPHACAPCLPREANIDHQHLWQKLLTRLSGKFDDLLRDIERHREFIIHEGLDHNRGIVQNVFEKAQRSIQRITQERKAGLDDFEYRDLYRLHIQEYSFLRNSLSWCSASNDQSRCVMFFDPQENTDSHVNYDRYGSMLLREVELTLLESLGFDPAHNDLLLVSSGQAAFNTIESFLVSQVLAPECPVVLSPYIYFEALEQLERLQHVRIHRSASWALDDIIHLVETRQAKVVFLDPLANLGTLNVLDLRALAAKLKHKNWCDKWLVMDGTMVSGGINPFALFNQSNHPNILYYESGSKYLQLGLDLQMAGIVVCSKTDAPALNIARRNTGSVMYQATVTRFPSYDRAIFLGRMHLLSRNAAILAKSVQSHPYLSTRIKVAYPQNWRALGWNHGGGVVAICMRETGFNNRACLESYIDRLLMRCRQARLPLTKGVSFGFSTTRVSAAAAMADNMPPFLRFSVGEEKVERMLAISLAVTETLCHFLAEYEQGADQTRETAHV
jgi:cystathionine beta-lyase/cystathionine gamma-synthase